MVVSRIPEWVKENKMQAAKPYKMQPGKPLSLEFKIITASKADDLTAVKIWIAEHGFPDLPPMARSWTDEIARWGFKRQPVTDNIHWFKTETLVEQASATARSALEWIKLQNKDGAWIYSWDGDPGPEVLARLVHGYSRVPWKESDNALIAISVLSAHWVVMLPL